MIRMGTQNDPFLELLAEGGVFFALREDYDKIFHEEDKDYAGPEENTDNS